MYNAVHAHRRRVAPARRVGLPAIACRSLTDPSVDPLRASPDSASISGAGENSLNNNYKHDHNKFRPSGYTIFCL